jgi:hypothetical protein
VTLNRFVLDTDAIPEAQRELDHRLDALHEQIHSLVRHYSVGDTPVLGLVMQITQNRAELERVAIGIGKLAVLVEEHDLLHKRKSCLGVLHQDPWVAGALGDFSETVERGLHKWVDAGDEGGGMQ